MLVSGVRSSWLTIERKSSLIRCAACSRAIRSWRSDHSCAFWSAGPARSATASAMPPQPAGRAAGALRPRRWPARRAAARRPRSARQHPVEVERAHAVGVARARVGPVPLGARGVAATPPAIPSPTRGRRSSTSERHRFDELVVGAGGRLRQEPALGVVDRAARSSRRPSSGAAPDGDRLASWSRARATRRSRGRAG